MGILKSVFFLDSIISQVILVLFFIFLFFSLFLLFRRCFLKLIVNWQQRKTLDFTSRLLSFLNGNMSFDGNLKKYRNNFIRDQLLKLGKSLSGIEKKRLIMVYRKLNFLKKDVSQLRYGSQKSQSESLARLRVLSIPLSDRDWLSLLMNSCSTFRWATMEYLIHVKKSNSFLWLARFLTDERNQNNGVRQHLLCCIASLSPDLLLMILTYTDDKDLVEQCLHTLSVYPHPRSEKTIIKTMSLDLTNEAYLSAVKALGGAITDRVLKVFLLAVTHPNADVRLAMAKSLFNIDDLKAYQVLLILTEDFNYYVRFHAVKSLLSMKDRKFIKLETISGNKDHPSHLILDYFNQKERLLL